MSPEQSGLLKKAHRSVDSARVLAERGHFDFAASRAYYAMFYVAEALLLSRGLAFSSHSAVNAAFGEHFAKAGLIDASFHRYLIEGQDARTKSDYDIEADISQAEAAKEIAHADEFIQAAERLLGG